MRTHRDLDAFWSFIKAEDRSYEGRRRIIRAAFEPAMDHAESRSRAPADAAASDVLRSFDAKGVHVVWEKALARHTADPEGAITVARTLLETVTKRILDEMGENYGDKDDLQKALRSCGRRHRPRPLPARGRADQDDPGRRGAGRERDRHPAQPLLGRSWPQRA